ncbi:MAG: hypothetical protein WDO24_21750 [Pseudomonadota bacterium]
MPPRGPAGAGSLDAPAAGGALHLDHVSKHYGAVRAVDDVDISLAPGEFLTLLGRRDRARPRC